MLEEVGENDASSSSSSSSSASSSEGDSDQAAQRIQSVGKAPVLSSSSSSPTTSPKRQRISPASVPEVVVKAEHKDAPGDEKEEAVRTERAAKRDRGNYEPFGPHHLVRRFKAGVCTGLQMSCRAAGHGQGCSKEMSLTVGGNEEKIE